MPEQAQAQERISIHAPRTGSDVRRKDGVTYDNLISIHAPRTGSDIVSRVLQIIVTISIHAPRTGSDLLSAGFCKSL